LAESAKPDRHKKWYMDARLGGVCNHETRGHIRADLHRYFFAAVFAREKKRSPLLEDFPKALLPKHANVAAALKETKFNDRFRVQLAGRPSTTVVSHISKDGHYYIHYDPAQCRSLTVREAARLQTFPDNYFFEGERTEQYKQVGNAVPPLLAKQIARVVADLFV
jgi:DNA (cytosine-5)-methyltransferase 1